MATTPAPLDGVAAPAKKTPSVESARSPQVSRWKRLLLAALVSIYVVYGLWSILLVSLTPSRDPALKSLPMIGVVVAGIAALIFIGVGALMLQRISASHTDSRSKLLALIKVVVALAPGIILSAIVPLLTLRALPIEMNIVSPPSDQELVAPVSMTFSVEGALSDLALEGFVPSQYRWDVNSDQKVDQETNVPELTATFEREGSHAVTVLMIAADGSQKVATKRFVIRRSVFKVTPEKPITNQAAIFSLAHLYAPQGAVKDVQWDFNEDGQPDETTTSLETTHTFFREGTVTVRALVSLTNNTQTLYERAVTIIPPPPLPFPVTLSTQPKLLIGSAPFPTLFTITTDESIGKIAWDFGDGQSAEGPRVAHTFTEKGVFPVNARVTSASGVTAVLQTTVRIVDPLRLGDLTFEGTPEVRGSSIQGEVPLSLNLTPKTATPFIEFTWEAPDATEVGSTDTTLQAIYRREGTYTVTLIGQDLEDHVLRMPIEVTVQPASSSLSIAMDPESGLAPLKVKFDASESFIPGETITGFIWNFGDSTAEEFGGARTEHTFTKEGTYSISLTARTTTGQTFTTRRTLVVREALLRACITPSRLRGPAPLGVSFSSGCSVGTPTSVAWDFGDGSQSDQRDVIHVFEKPGTYTVQLTVKTKDASNTTSITITAE